MAAFPAEAADDNFLNLMISAPLYYTLGVNSSFTHLESTNDKAFFPLIVAFLISGYIVGEWFPQTANFLISVTFEFVLSASCDTALL
jgi:hypothetical protein